MPKAVKSFLVTLVIIAVTATAITPSSAKEMEEHPQPYQDASEVTTKAVFNNPAGGDPETIVREICNLIRQAPSGSRIRIAQFVISGAAGMDFAKELIAAHRRGVDVQIVIDGWQVDNPAMAAIIAELGRDKSARSWVHICSRRSPEGNTSACIGDKGQHNKFYLFSETGGKSNVVVQSSANVTDLNSTTYWNNALILVGNWRLYRAYNTYFEDLAAEVESDDYYWTVTTGMAGGSVRAHFFPRAGTDASTDPIVEALKKVDCRSGTFIGIGMSEWDAYRIKIAEKLADLANDGCSVLVVHGPIDDEVRDVLQSVPRIEVRELNDGSQLPGRIHSKYMIINGMYDGDTDAKWVFTGSHNYNLTSLRRNDETMLQTNIRGIYELYKANLLTMRKAATVQ